MSNNFNTEKIFILTFIILIFTLTIWNTFFKTSDTKFYTKENQLKESKDLESIKNGIVNYYCKYNRFPLSPNDIAPEFIDKIPKDSWGNDYILTSLAWRTKGSGMDLVATGKDGKVAGKGENIDNILRIDIDKINCNKS